MTQSRGLTAQIIRNTLPDKLTRDLYAPTMGRLVREHLDAVLAEARARTPRNTGDLADSLKVYINRQDGYATSGGVHTSSRKARFVHGRFAVPAPPRRRTRPHWPPDNQSLRAWARAKGIPIRLLQVAIARRGTPIVPFLAEAAEKEQANLPGRVQRAADAIERKWRN